MSFVPRLGRLWIRLRVRLGVRVSLDTEDRRVLERKIIPYFAGRDDIRRVLFVGTAWYTAHYHEMFSRTEYWTIDPVASRQKYGGRNHIVGRVDQLAQQVAPGFFDCIVMNGVIGFGLNEPLAVEASIAAVAYGLRPGGHFFLGWDDVDAHRIMLPEEIEALAGFERLKESPLGAFRTTIKCDTHKTFDFYVRT